MRVRKIKKRGKTKYSSKTMCTHSKWANEQTLKTHLPVKTNIQIHIYNNEQMHAKNCRLLDVRIT